MTFQQTQQYLNSFINHEIHLGQVSRSEFKLDRVRRLLKELGDPQNDLKIIHVAGSKGKGSICAMTASILQSAGYKVGLYTSPHINNIRERIRILTKPTSQVGFGLGSDIFPDMISEEEMGEVLEEIKPAIEKLRDDKELGCLTFFEVFTVLALCYFRKQKTDFVILETGLGGRLDATNAVDSLIAVIAPISLEHTHILGDAVEQIAQEKAAIIKDSRQNVVIASQDDQAREVLKKRCDEFDIEPLWVDEVFKCGEITKGQGQQIFDLTTLKTVYEQIRLPLLGKHQRDNAAVVVGIVECLQELGFKVSAVAVGEGFKSVFWPGRFEIVRTDPIVILDGAHNQASAKVLAQTVRDVVGEKKIILVLGVSGDKDIELICEELKEIAGEIIFTKADHPRAYDFQGAVRVEEALGLAIAKAGKEGIVLVAGSIFVVAEARRVLKFPSMQT